MTNTWDERYSEPGAAFGDRPNDFLASQEQLIRSSGGRRALCLGEGEGRNALWLAQMGFAVTAVDLSLVGLNNARARATRLGVAIQTVQADLSHWQIAPDKWDLIVSIFCHLPPETRARVHQSVVAGLAPGGLYILESYGPSQLGRKTGGPSDVSMLASAEQLTKELYGLDFLTRREVSRDVTEGQRHTGMADVVQIVAVKGRSKE